VDFFAKNGYGDRETRVCGVRSASEPFRRGRDKDSVKRREKDAGNENG